jgi:serine/threonine-protein kinase RsbW
VTLETARASERPRLVIEAAATLASLPLLSRLVHRFLIDGCALDAESPETVRIRLALQEAVTNVLRHAYAGGEPGPITLELACEGDELVARLRDRGARFDPVERRDAAASSPRPDLGRPAEIPEGGYGMAIIRNVMTAVEYSYDAGRGNELVLRKSLTDS